MNRQRHQRLKALFEQARRQSGADREALLQRECSDDADLREELEALLAVQEQSSDFLAEPILGSDFALALTGNEAAAEDLSFPERIGRYRILCVLGQGGMGTVYKAEQDTPSRIVALKVIHQAMATPAMLRRFELEAEVLGRLQHPAIAHIYDADVAQTALGSQPFLAMEFVEGRSLIEYADGARLDTAARLRLWARVCEAVEHAHQKGIIHRDLKPANILVDRSGRPKVLDFGVARVADPDSMTLNTQAGQVLGTIPYMSPEQVMGDPAELDTRTDVYALGIIGYELLTGQRPYDVAGRSMPEAARIIMDQEATPLGAMSRIYRGDLETITAKALEKDKSRRYQSAAELAGDIQRYLDNEPILARPATTMYQIKKLVARHKLPSALVAVLALLVIGFALFAARQTAVIARERDAALLAQANEEHARTIAEQQADAAQLEAERKEAVNDFLVSVLSAASPAEAQGRDIDIRIALDQAATQIASRLLGDPMVDVSVRHTIGETYLLIGAYEPSDEHLTAALQISQQQFGEVHVETARVYHTLGMLRRRQGRLDDAETFYRKAIGVYDVLLEAHAPERLQTESSLAALLHRKGNLQEAETIYRRLLELADDIPPSSGFDLPTAMGSLAHVLTDIGKVDEATPLLERALELGRKNNGELHPNTLSTMGSLGELYTRHGRHMDAELMHRNVLELRRQVLGDEHQDTVESMNNLAQTFSARERHDEAAPLLRKVIEINEARLGSDHLDTLTAMNNLAACFKHQGNPAEATAMYRQVADVLRRILGPEHPHTLSALNNLAGMIRLQGQPQEALEIFVEIVATAQTSLPEGHWLVAAFQMGLGNSHRDLEQYEPAEQAYLSAYDRFHELLGDQHANTAKALDSLIDLHERWEKPDRAATYRALLDQQHATTE